MNKRWRNAGLLAILAIIVIALGKAFFDKQPQSRETWRYNQFIQEVEKGRVKRVTLNSDRTKALVTPLDGEKKVVDLPNNPDLIDTLIKNKIEIAVLPQTDEGYWFKALSSLALPIYLLLVGLLLSWLIRTRRN